ncbi:glycosyltransferase [Rothia halotolerans]|uniref:glycosyltransferase n=1 Tax=Rothia halotolerans TaxID=405770 RepID=UPI00101C6B76|nr:glycosyltransferase [Rothia halotolerans]
MIGYYVHHHGSGHLARATAVARAMEEEVTGLSSLPRPADWPGEWIELPLDDDAGTPRDPDGEGRLHWVPLGSPGLLERTALISGWISSARPSAVVVDVSVEVALLVRLHGVPVVAVALPGDRADPAHQLGFDVATAILGAWPPQAADCLSGLSDRARRKLVPVGAIGRLAPFPERPPGSAPGRRRVLVLSGTGGEGFADAVLSRARRETEDWSWEHLGGSGSWASDVRPHLEAATVVLSHAGQGSLADISAARRPAIIVPQPRPHEEQRATGRVLRSGGWPAIVLDEPPQDGWGPLLDRATALDGSSWGSWNDGQGASRAAGLIARVAEGKAR